MNVLCRFPRLFFGRLTSSKLNLKNVFSKQAMFYSTNHLPFENVLNLKKDVLLYSFEKTKIIKYTTIFGIAQLGVWVYFAGYLFFSLKDISESGIKTDDVLTKSSLWKRINLGDWKYRIISTTLCLLIGIATTFLTYTLPTRIVKELTLCKGGKLASFVIYGPFAKTKSFQVPLEKISCAISREQAKSYVPIKIQNIWFFYLVDRKGKFHQPKLFDYTIGTRKVK